MDQEEFKKRNLSDRDDEVVKKASTSPIKIGQTVKAFQSFCGKCKKLAIKQIMVSPKDFNVDQLCSKCRAKVSKIWK